MFEVYFWLSFCCLLGRRANIGLHRTLAIIYSHHVDFENIFVNNTGNRVDSCTPSSQPPPAKISCEY
jgi:hypothetical protein